MKKVTNDILKQDSYFLFINSPFCGTCHVARSMLDQIESIYHEEFFYEMNASFFPEFMQEHKIESVPCLLIRKDNETKEKIYAFRSVSNIFKHLIYHEPERFIKDEE
ncbi:thioredoxin family protein [Ornithinibacillus sp. 4-3]|uniref:Thioredoxin family protein n=1 Tax=Ornithinibacillus sp. 4-3 TaxID=3231488 RepID=A0AB39HN31_9BACI